MSAFKWHLMSEEEPEEGSGLWLLRGRGGGTYVAKEYDRHGVFYVPNNRSTFFSADQIHAWACIPPVSGPSHRCADCDRIYHDESFDSPWWCDWWEKVVKADGFCHEYRPKEES